MTAIIAHTDGDKVWIGGDSGVITSGWRKLGITDRKVWTDNEIILGLSGSIRILELLKYSKYKEIDKKSSDREYVMAYANNIKHLMSFQGIDIPDEDYEFTIIAGYKGKIYLISQDCSATQLSNDTYAIGDGGDLVMGAFLAHRMNAISIEGSMLRALEITGNNNMTVAPPYYVEVL